MDIGDIPAPPTRGRGRGRGRGKAAKTTTGRGSRRGGATQKGRGGAKKSQLDVSTVVTSTPLVSAAASNKRPLPSSVSGRLYYCISLNTNHTGLSLPTSTDSVPSN